MDAPSAELISKLTLDEEKDDVVYFAFPNQTKKVKCSISVLTEWSSVFGTMFSDRWNKVKTENVNAIQTDASGPAPKDNTIPLQDAVNFDQYSIFRLLMQVQYGLRRVDLLSVDQATSIYYYAHKYQLQYTEANVQRFLNARMESGISKLPLSVAELTNGIEFAELYNLDEFKKKLDQVTLAFDKDNLNAIQFWNLATRFGMNTLQRQIADHMMNVTPHKDWPFGLLLAVTQRLQRVIRVAKNSMKNLTCGCNKPFQIYCCGNNSVPIPSFFKSP